jgi:hypothetical protein
MSPVSHHPSTAIKHPSHVKNHVNKAESQKNAQGKMFLEWPKHPKYDLTKLSPVTCQHLFIHPTVLAI